MGVYIIPNPKNFLALSGGTVSGDTYFSQNLSAATYFSGSTPLETTIYNIASTFALTFSAGTNLYVVSSSTYPHITYGLNNSINIPGTVYGNIISGTTFVSGGTNLQDIFVLSGANLGGGINVFEQKLNNNLLFNTILGSGQTTASKVGNNVVLYTPATTIPSSAYIWTTTTFSGSYRITNWTGDSISRGTIVASQNSFIGYRSSYSGLFVGKYNAINRYSNFSLILGGLRNTINSSYYGTIIGGIRNELGQYYGSPSNYQKHSFIIGGNSNKLSNGYYSGIIGGSNNIITGDTYSADNGVYSSFIFGSSSSKISGALHSFIIGGHSNLINHSATHTTIIGGQFITANTPNTLITPNLRLSSLSNPTATTPYSLFADSNGYVFKKNFVGTGGIFVNNSISAVTFSYTGNTYGGINNGINTFTGGTDLAQTVNVTALTINNITVSGSSNFNTLSSTTFSAGTINSGTTNLYNIFATPGQLSTNNNGINTFTAGTSTFQSINVTGLSINNITVSGLSSFQSLSATTLYSGSTDLSLLIPAQTLLQNGTNTFTGGTFSRPTVNVTALTINTVTASGNSNFNILSATTFSAGTINSGSTNLYDIFALPSQISTNNNGINTFTAGTSNFQSINVTGLSINNISVSGNSNFNTLSATTFSAGTINSGSTNLYDIFLTIGSSGEANTASNLSGGVGLFSTKVGVDLRFRSLSGGSGIGITQETNTVTITYTGTSSSGGGNVINGINTFTAGTSSAQSVNVTALTINTIVASGNSNFNTLSATTLSAGTINSGSTNLYDIFALPSQISTNSNGINTFTGGSSTFQSINVTGLSINNITVSGSSSFQSLSAVTLYSGSTDISLLIPAQTLLQNGTNTFTGGTSARPTVNVTALTVDNIVVSGFSNFNTLSANTLSGATIYSGSTNLNSLLGEVNTASNLGTTGNGIFAQKSGVDLQFKSLSAGTGINILTSTTTVTIAVNDIDSYLNLSGGTVTGITNFNSGLSANTLSGGTIYSGSTPLQNIFVVSGQNLSTSGTSVFVNKTGSDLNFRTLSGSSGTSLSVTNNVITITSPNIPSGAYLFIPSSGYRSIIQANGGNLAVGRFSFAVGTGNSANANYSVSLNGKSNTVGSAYGSSIGGRNNIDSSNFNGLILTSSGASIDDSSSSYNTIIGSKNIKIFSNKFGLESKYTLVENSNNSKLYQNNFGITLGSNTTQIGYLNLLKPKTHYSNIINSTNSKIYSNFSSILNSKNSFIIDKQSSGSSIISSYATSQAFIRYNRRSSLIFSKESYIDANTYFKSSSYNSHIIGSDSSNTYNSQNSLILISRNSSVGYKTSKKQFFAGTLIATDGVTNKSERFGFAINSTASIIEFKARYSGLINSSSINIYNSIGSTSNNLIAINSSNSIVDGYKFNTIIGTSNSYIKPYSTEQSSYSFIFGGVYGRIKQGINSFIVGGNNNSITQVIDSGIIGGNTNSILPGLVGSVIVGGKNISLNQSYTVAVPELRVTVLPSGYGSIVVADTNGYLKKSNLSVSNLVYSVLPGINTFTAGTANNPTINVTALTINTLIASGSSRFTILSAATFSAGTIYSANTNLDQIFHLKSGYLLQKNGLVSGSTFAGSPLTANVVFTSSFSNNNYIITITGEDARMWSISSKSVAGFTINSNSSIAITGNVFWMASENGEGYR